MRRLSATEAARRFADVLDAVERRGETFVVVRRGRPVARIEPAAAGTGAVVKKLIRGAPRDSQWLRDVEETRRSLQVEDRRWTA